ASVADRTTTACVTFVNFLLWIAWYPGPRYEGQMVYALAAQWESRLLWIIRESANPELALSGGSAVSEYELYAFNPREIGSFRPQRHQTRRRDAKEMATRMLEEIASASSEPSSPPRWSSSSPRRSATAPDRRFFVSAVPSERKYSRSHHGHRIQP